MIDADFFFAIKLSWEYQFNAEIKFKDSQLLKL